MHGHLHHLLHEYGAGVVGLVLFFESMGAPLPGESLLIAAAILSATTGGPSIYVLIPVAALGAILGDNAGFVIGRALGARLLARYGARVGLTERRLRIGQTLFRRHGGKIVLIARFVAFLRTMAALLAGANRMPWPGFLLWNAAGGIAWTGLYGIGAYLLGAQAHRLAGPIGIGIGVLVAIAAVPLFLWLRRQAKSLETEDNPESGAATVPESG